MNTTQSVASTITAAIAYSAETGAAATIRVAGNDADKFAAAHNLLCEVAAGGSALREGGEHFHGQDAEGRCWNVRLVFVSAQVAA